MFFENKNEKMAIGLLKIGIERAKAFKFNILDPAAKKALEDIDSKIVKANVLIITRSKIIERLSNEYLDLLSEIREKSLKEEKKYLQAAADLEKVMKKDELIQARSPIMRGVSQRTREKRAKQFKRF